ncbi:hypothetical protein K5X82_13245 [Halosquirtibacter xylanolyticus]|uniref:hypothetical protein n=1 Tax=Halosquirtibacter xylanolyticus TaxID=3374599 RepID=UPI0037485724|nr:hypothetical protein K5X82_13245 [Prolixibacteraceae bacterium]
MKRILLSFVVLAVASAAAFAQSTGDAPYPGSKHVYRVASDGENQVWKIRTYDAVAGFADADLATATLTNANTKEVTIDWGVGVAAGTTYYVQVEDSKAGCKNLRLLPITIAASTFDMLLTFGGGEVCYTNQVDPSIEGGKIAYTHGQAVVPYVFSVEGVNAGDNWSTTVTMGDITDVTIDDLVSTDGTVTVTDNGAGVFTLTGTGVVADITLNLTVNNVKKYLEAAGYNGEAEISPLLSLTAQTILNQKVADKDAANDNATGTVKRYSNSNITFD